ncbi:MAG: hypothetical protein SPL73_02080 [Cyanobacteriota bacterium]|nr:hypothetical protein [Cyanobacteriota bacterium]MDY6358683.1 hypothetical protein [Cyanobacteriota bacterium]MDY6363662.1 hypothetical protein [Cyanobacteriota bacterium]MDY6382580.1 hypothetical protein [Cyanobacteriota bacterium]
MNDFDARDIEKMFSNLCCSRCRNDFSADSLIVKQKIKNIYICNLSCKKCDKDFGDIVLRYNKHHKKHSPMVAIDGPDPISADDVIDAHNYIKHNL